MQLITIGSSSVVLILQSNGAPGIMSLRQAQHDVPFTWVDCGDKQNIAIKINIKDMSIYDDLIYADGKIELNLSSAFEKYKLSRDLLEDEAYVTGAIINAATRGLNNSELFFMAYNALAIFPEKNHFYGSLVTLISYKYLEAPECRGWVVRVLLGAKNRFDSSADSYAPNSVRWGISSATALSLALLMHDRLADAEEVIDSALLRYEPNINQLSYWNYCQCLILKATLRLHAGEQAEAGWRYLAAFDFSRTAINNIYHSRNDWILGQISDCHALLRLGELAMKAAAKTLGPIPSESRSASIGYDGPIDLMPVFSRIPKARSKFDGKFFDAATKILNAL